MKEVKAKSQNPFPWTVYIPHRASKKGLEVKKHKRCSDFAFTSFTPAEYCMKPWLECGGVEKGE